MAFDWHKMKRLFPTTLALLLVMASFGHLLAASFCPRTFGRECCIAKTADHTHCPSSSDLNQAADDMHAADMHVHAMPMDGMNMDNMSTADMAMDQNGMDVAVMDDLIADLSLPSRSASGEEDVANEFRQPIAACAHCLAHSGIVNAPISSANVADQSNKGLGSVVLSVSRFFARPALALTQVGLPREHAPPNSSAPRHLLISVFLI